MPRNGGLLGPGSLGRRVVEAAAQRTLGVDLHEQEALRGQLVEAVGDLRMLDVLNRRIGRLALSALRHGLSGQDDEPEDRLAIVRKVREVARRDSQMLYAVRLRNAFCFGQGVPDPRAPDEEVQAIIDDFWTALPNRAELTEPASQWRAGKDLWEQANLYLVVFADGLDARVLLGSLQHDQVIDVVRDPEVWRRVLYYKVVEWVYEWDFERDEPKPNPTRRIVYYEALDGMAELEEDVKAGRTAPAPRPPAAKLRPGRVLHVAINRGREQAFGEPEMRTNLRWAAAFNDILAGQVEKAKAAQGYLMKVRAKGARTQDQLAEVAMRAVGRTSPLATANLDPALDPAGAGAPPPANRPPGLPVPSARPGSQFWENDSLEAEPFDLKSGGAEARSDMQSASQAFAVGTNYPGHYFFGDPGSLAGSMAVELPVLKLTEIDQALWEGSVFRRLLDLTIARAVELGKLSERRPPTDEEVAGGVEVGPDGLVERDLSYELNMPDALRRNVPELMQVVVSTVASFDPSGENEPMVRALLGYVLTDLLDFSDAPALVERIMTAREQAAQAAQAQADAIAAGGGGGIDPATGQPIPASGDPATSTGADGRQHTSANPYGARQQSPPVVEAAMRELWAVLTEQLADGGIDRVLEAAGTNGGG